MNKVHLRHKPPPIYPQVETACGKTIDRVSRRLTDDLAEVTCGTCRSTVEFNFLGLRIIASDLLPPGCALIQSAHSRVFITNLALEDPVPEEIHTQLAIMPPAFLTVEEEWADMKRIMTLAPVIDLECARWAWGTGVLWALARLQHGASMGENASQLVRKIAHDIMALSRKVEPPCSTPSPNPPPTPPSSTSPTEEPTSSTSSPETRPSSPISASPTSEPTDPVTSSE